MPAWLQSARPARRGFADVNYPEGSQVVDAAKVANYYGLPKAGVAKLVYAPDSKSGEVTLMSVRVRPPAPTSYPSLRRQCPSSNGLQTGVQGFHPPMVFKHVHHLVFAFGRLMAI